MARIPGGITSRPSGKLGNIIFGAARTPEGKVATAREAVDPSNPNTPDQQQQRSQFRVAVRTVQQIGPSIYQGDWNRSVGQLPGFQSWQSILLNNYDNNGDLQTPPARQLGKLHVPSGWSPSQGASSSEIDVSWTTETGPNGTSSDEAVLIAINGDGDSTDQSDVVVSVGNATRTDGADTLTGLKADTRYIVCFYFRGAGSAAGLLTTAGFKEQTTAP